MFAIPYRFEGKRTNGRFYFGLTYTESGPTDRPFHFYFFTSTDDIFAAAVLYSLLEKHKTSADRKTMTSDKDVHLHHP